MVWAKSSQECAAAFGRQFHPPHSAKVGHRLHPNAQPRPLGDATPCECTNPQVVWPPLLDTWRYLMVLFDDDSSTALCAGSAHPPSGRARGALERLEEVRQDEPSAFVCCAFCGEVVRPPAESTAATRAIAAHAMLCHIWSEMPTSTRTTVVRLYALRRFLGDCSSSS